MSSRFKAWFFWGCVVVGVAAALMGSIACDGDGEGFSRDEPLPFGETLEMEMGMTLGIEEVERDAWSQVQAQGLYDSPPGEGMEYILVRVAASYEGENTLEVEGADFSVVGDRNKVYQWIFFGSPIAGKNSLEGKFYGGAQMEGWLGFEVAQGEGELVLIYEPSTGGQTAYLTLE